MFIAINRGARRQRRRLLTLAAVLMLAGVVLVAHSAMGGDHMDQGTVMCVAVLQVAAFAVAAIAAGVPRALLPLAWAPGPARNPALALLAFPPQPRARAGPAALQVFRL